MNSQHRYLVAANDLHREFTQAHPNQVWVDITYIATREGWLYLSVFVDLYSRRVVERSCRSTLGHEIVVDALQRAIGRRHPPPGLMIHSDRAICLHGFSPRAATTRMCAEYESEG